MRRRTGVALVALVAVALAVTLTTTSSAERPDGMRVLPHGAMGVERAAHQATWAGSALVVTGGCADPGCENILASVERYDPATGTFAAEASMPTPRASHVAVPLPDGRILVAGGWTGSRATSTAELRDPETGRFVSSRSMSAARMGAAAVALRDGRALVVGGEGSDRERLASAEAYDPSTHAFTPEGSMATPRTSHTATLLADGRVLVTGGDAVRGGDALRSAEVFDPATGRFHATGAMAEARHKHAAVLLRDGRVLVVGGSRPGAARGRGRLATTEIYDPTTGRFAPGPDLAHPRHKLGDAVAVLESGTVVVGGGGAPVEAWEPGSASFTTVAGAATGARQFATATVLPDGRVLVAGGYDERITPSAAAWLVVPPR